jgi:transposase
MLNLARGIRVFLATTPLDMRGSYDAMAGRARRLGLEPVNGGYYVFLSKSRKQLAVLHYDGSGWCTFRKRLELGTFELPAVPDGVAHLAVDPTVLASILSGIVLGAPRRRWYDHDRTART